MSTTSAAGDSNPEATSLPAFALTSRSFHYAITHVFLPVQLPKKSDYTLENDLSLARAVSATADTYSIHTYGASEPQWDRITKMLDNLQASVQSEHLDKALVVSQLRSMQAGDILTFFIRLQNAAIILTRQENSTLFESFEVSPRRDAVEKTAGSLICSYPYSAIETPDELSDDENFQHELADFLSRPGDAYSDLFTPLPGDPQHITALLSVILRGIDHTVDIPRITKHVRDDVGSPWRRSSLWLLIRVAIQTSVDRSPLGRAIYKRFMLFFMCTLAKDENNVNLSSDLLHLMSSKIFRRSRKLGSSTPDWLSKMALETCDRLREILDARWNPLRSRPSPFRNPTQDELIRDTELSLLNSREYIRNALANRVDEPLDTTFHPSHRRRGTIDDFLSLDGTFFEEAYAADPDVTLYDVERSVEQGIDDWCACVTDVDDACAQLEILMDKYMIKAWSQRDRGPEDTSIMLLTAIELFVALDRLVMKEIPLLADYSPEVPIGLLERLLVRKTTSFHRLSCAYQYLSARESRSRPGWSVLSDKFDTDSFAVRYYDQSPHLQQVKARIEQDMTGEVAGRIGVQQDAADPTSTYDRTQEDQQHLLSEGAKISRLPLPTLPLHAKLVVFELQCPACVRIWRSAAPRILHYIPGIYYGPPLFAEKEKNLLAHVPPLRPYFFQREGPPLSFQLHFVYVYPSDPQSWLPQTLRYAVRHPSFRRNYDSDGNEERSVVEHLSKWKRKKRYENWQDDYCVAYEPTSHSHEAQLEKYVNSTSHTSNDVLSDQADCPANLSLDEFIAFTHLRSGGFIQWLNILQGLRGRTLNFRRDHVHFLLACAVFQVGPLDVKTGAWVWHQELQDSFFCTALLDELESLFMHVGAGSIDVVMMSTISLLLTRVLASSPRKSVSERTIVLLQSVRRKTFGWVQELSYDLGKSPMNKQRGDLLRDMAATCRSTFDVDPATLPKLLSSPEDVDALLSCAFLIHELHSKSIYDHRSRLLLERDSRLSLILEDTLMETALTDVSDYGIDLAVGRIFACHKPGAHRWEQLEHPKNRWLTCRSNATMDQLSHMFHINLLGGALRVDGRPLGGLPPAIRDSPEFQEIFCDQDFFVIPSNLPGMEFKTRAVMSKHEVHFSLRGDNLAIRARCSETDDVIEFIPPSRLREDLPPSLVDGHVHQLSPSAKAIEIRPLAQLWKESSENWRIDCAPGQYRMYKGRETLVDIRSPTWAMVSQCFECLNNVRVHKYSKNLSKNLLITASLIDTHQSTQVLRLSVALPCYGLSFFVNELGELESGDFKDMVYDEDQSIEALFGLESLLVLRQKTNLPEGLIPRRVIIPYGFPNKHDDHHVLVDTQHLQSIPLYYTYDVDTELGCLTGNGSFQSVRFLAYLHAMTSWHRPDPLTGKMGVQASLCLLQSAGCRSIMELKALDDNYAENRHLWSSTQYPQINLAHQDIRHRYYWNRYEHYRGTLGNPEKRAAHRAAHLFPWNATESISLEDHDDMDYSTPEANSELEDVASHAASVVYYLQVTLTQLLCNRPAPVLPPRSTLLCDIYMGNKPWSDGIPTLDQLFCSLETDSSFHREYITHLDASAQHLVEESRVTHRVVGESSIEAVKRHYAQCRDNYTDGLATLQQSLGPTDDLDEQALNRHGQWSPITADSLLRYLASTSPLKLPGPWRECLTSLALLLLDLQRARRLLRLALDGLEEEFSKELENEGCDGWNAEDYPDWLLIQIQGNFLIRRAQAEIVMEIMSPQSGGSTVMQVNMGEGKSSVIIPIAAAALADGKQLVRVIVPKALTVQMFELLVSRLGGLANRPIYHLPFSRLPKFGHNGEVISLQIDDLHKFMSECMAEHGIILVQPEHVVSLKLTSVEEQIRKGTLPANSSTLQKLISKHIVPMLSLKLLSEDSLVGNMLRRLSQSPDHRRRMDATHDGHYNEYRGGARGASDSASKWLSLQRWIHSHVRDILDESDEILHPRFQLIYTTGLQQHMDGYPERWTITQQVLQLVKKHADSLSRYAPDSIVYECGPPGSFPHFRIVRACDGGRRLISHIVGDVMTGRLPNFNFQCISQRLRNAIRSFIFDEDVLQIPDTVKMVEEYANTSHQSNLWGGLLLLRGLLASNILLFALSERRWCVDYGLVSQPQYLNHSPTPIMLAVPYRAKGVPAPDTQFGHPDITIILTCLSYYYTGLRKEQLRVSFEILLDQDDPSTEYARWVEEYDCIESVPASLRKLGELNLRSSEKWDELIFPHFSRNKAAIDFYLSRVVFPQEAKEFPGKLCGSSWDLAEKREKVITGFSGTNDGQWLLPTSISQHDLDRQRGANARVLAYILRPENDSYMVTHDSENGERWTTFRLLQTISTRQPEIRILLDVGAQILDFSNFEVADAWLDTAVDSAGAIYFDENDELMVLTRDGTTLPILSSPLSQQFDRCVVYLDHAHTRGTDIKLPVGSRAAVTLGPSVTKDNLVQGCMRMRKLGHGHSVMFFAPLEVDQSIRSVTYKKDPNVAITNIDILCWAIHETWTDIQQRAPYWAQQGMNHKSRNNAWSQFESGKLTQERLADAWLQPEFKSLADLYAPSERQNASGSLSELDPEIRQHCKNLGVLSLPTAQLAEEQEREVNREREREREVELPPKAEPAEHVLHQAVETFVKTGIIPSLHSRSAFRPVFTALENSSAAPVEAGVWSSRIMATADFCETIKPESTQGTIDQYLRPVQWILSSRKEQVLVLLSPFEVNWLMPEIRASEYVHLHVYAPRTSQRMKPSDDLELYSIPPLPSDWTPPWALIDQLNLFAGQLYLRDYESYLRLCRFLCTPTKELSDDTAVRWNAFSVLGGVVENEIKHSGSQLPFVMALLAIRSRGRPFAQTHMGKMLQGQVLTAKDFEEPTPAVSLSRPS